MFPGSFDVSPEEFQLFQDGFVDALIVQDPYTMGYTGMQDLDKVIKGGHISHKVVQIPAVVVTKDTLGKAQVQKLLKSYPDIAKLLK
jgi:ribose transport system substrate-binding protein